MDLLTRLVHGWDALFNQMSKAIDITGQRFGRLVAVRFDKKIKYLDGNEPHYWLFRCDCGKEVIISKHSVRYGDISSCGCYNLELLRGRVKHGMTKTRFYKIFYGIKKRCLNLNSNIYNKYGGRGIKLLWKSFEEFKSDMYESYLIHTKEFGERNTTIERINNNGNYCKENCKWATWKEQGRNTNCVYQNGQKNLILALEY